MLGTEALWGVLYPDSLWTESTLPVKEGFGFDCWFLGSIARERPKVKRELDRAHDVLEVKDDDMTPRHVHSVSMYKLFVDQFRRLWARVLHALETGEDAPGLAKK
ncbi:hypothetical protein HRG_014217 [Hirsutella rhossiliensis]